MNKNYWIFIIWNMLCLICWTVLAIVFDAWGLALFSAFFISYPKTSHYIICDKCGKHSPMTENHNKALEKAKECGWIRVKNGEKWEDYCPECQEK